MSSRLTILAMHAERRGKRLAWWVPWGMKMSGLVATVRDGRWLEGWWK